MRLVTLQASPRPKGNSTALANRFLDRAEQLGAEVERFNLNKLVYRGCQACMGCKGKSERCVLKDDLAPVLEAVHGADVVVAASPIYWYDVSAQLKTFIDRAYSFMTPDYLTSNRPSRLAPGKKMIMILAQGSDYDELPYLIRHYGRIFSRQGFDSVDIIYAQGIRNLGDAARNPEAMARAEKAAEKLFR